jgi:hypothetical protein
MMLAIVPIVAVAAVIFGRFIRKYGKKTQDKVELAAYAEIMPEFPGGAEALSDYFKKNSIFPIAGTKEKQQNRVIVSFVVEATGN